MRRARLLANDPETAGDRQSIHNPPLCQVMHRFEAWIIETCTEIITAAVRIDGS